MPLWVVLTVGGLLLLGSDVPRGEHDQVRACAWLPLLIGIIAFTVMTTWKKGREIVTRAREKAEGPLREFVDSLRDCQPPSGMSGTAVFLNRGNETAPLAMRANVEHNRVLHAHVIIMSIDTMPVPRLPTTSGRRLTSSAITGRHHPRQGLLRVHGKAEYSCRAKLLDPAHTEDHRRRCGFLLLQNSS